jgi:hypothetical protein
MFRTRQQDSRSKEDTTAFWLNEELSPALAQSPLAELREFEQALDCLLDAEDRELFCGYWNRLARSVERNQSNISEIEPEIRQLKLLLLHKARYHLDQHRAQSDRATKRLIQRVEREQNRQDKLLKARKILLETSVEEVKKLKVKPAPIVHTGLKHLSSLLRHPILFNSSIFLICFMFSNPIVVFAYKLGIISDPNVRSTEFTVVYLGVAIAISFLLFLLLDLLWHAGDRAFVSGPEEKQRQLLKTTQKTVTPLLKEIDTAHMEMRYRFQELIDRLQAIQSPQKQHVANATIAFKPGNVVELKAPQPPMA